MTLIERDNDKVTLRPSGKSILAATVPDLRSKLRWIIDDGACDVVVDLSSVQTVDPSGMELLISAFNSLRKVGGQFSVINASAEILGSYESMRTNQHSIIREG